MLSENCSVPFVVALADEGEMLMEFTAGAAGGVVDAGAAMVTLAEADLVVSATLVAVMVAEPAAPGAV
jgi:hypothetical protein